MRPADADRLAEAWANLVAAGCALGVVLAFVLLMAVWANLDADEEE